MVPQKEELYVELDGSFYRVRKCLPGQQIAPVYWHEQLSADLRESGMQGNPACPVVFGGHQKGSTVHVDDGLLGGRPEEVDKVVSCLREKYKLEVSEPLREVGDKLRFLKRCFEVTIEGLQISIDPKYVEKVVSILGIAHPRSRKVPSTHEIRVNDNTEQLPPAMAGQFRAALGCILYIAPDRPDVQFTVSRLAQGMVNPTMHQWKCLKYLSEYLYSTRDYALVLRWSTPGRTLLDESPRHRPKEDDGADREPKVRILEAISDSDWAGNSDRKSVSSGHLYLDGNLMFAYARRQVSISLSSCEAELVASTGVIAEALYLKQILETLTPDKIEITARLDSSSARSIMSKSGVSRVRHLDVRLLWVQQLVHEKKVLLRAIGTKENTADVGAKPLPSERIRYLLGLMGFFNADGLLNSVKVRQVQHVRNITQPNTHHTRLLQMSTFLLALALSRGEENAMDDDNDSTENFTLVENDLKMWEQMILVSQLLWATCGELYGLAMITAEKYQVTGDTIILIIVLMFLVYGMFAWARSSTAPMSSIGTSTSPTIGRRFSTWTWLRPSSSSSTTKPASSSTTRTTSSSTSTPPGPVQPQGVQRPGSSSATSSTSTTTATATSGDRDQRERQYRLLREDFVKRWFASPAWFPAEEIAKRCLASEHGDCYHLNPDCPGLRNAKKIFRDLVETELSARRAPCQICCSSHWAIYEAARSRTESGL